jgi:hypothetical protein
MAPRIADPLRYPDFVKTATATTHDEGGASFRTILHVTTHEAFTQTGKVGVFIGANPSRALSDASDRTVNKVLWWLFNQGCSEIFVFNLSPYRATDAKDARRWLSESDNLALSERVNAVAIDQLAGLLSAKRPPVILAGWGDCLGKHAEDLACLWRRVNPSLTVAQVLAGAQAPLVCHLPLTKAGNPGHPLYPSLTKLLTRRGLP